MAHVADLAKPIVTCSQLQVSSDPGQLGPRGVLWFRKRQKRGEGGHFHKIY